MTSLDHESSCSGQMYPGRSKLALELKLKRQTVLLDREPLTSTRSHFRTCPAWLELRNSAARAGEPRRLIATAVALPRGLDPRTWMSAAHGAQPWAEQFA